MTPCVEQAALGGRIAVHGEITLLLVSIRDRKSVSHAALNVKSPKAFSEKRRRKNGTNRIKGVSSWMKEDSETLCRPWMPPRAS